MPRRGKPPLTMYFKKEGRQMIVYLASFIIIAVAFVLIARNFKDLKNHNEGTEDMKELAGIIRAGAKTFLKREYRIIIPTVIIVAVMYSLFREAWSGLTFIFGSLMSIAAVEIGMRGGTYANVRTTNAARVTGAMSRTMRIALLGGSLSGFTVPAFGLCGFLIVWLVSGGAHNSATGYGLILKNPCNAAAVRLMTYSLGCSVVAMFNRVAGGNYTKAADISADIVGKNIYDMPEDDSRMPNSIADFIGDCVNDIAGNISDLLESFVATPTACILIALQLFAANSDALSSATLFPFLLAGGGLFSSLLGVSYVIFKNRKRKKLMINRDTDEVEVVEFSREAKNPGEELNIATYLSACLMMVIALVGSYFIFKGVPGFDSFRLGWISPWIAALLGIVSSVAVGKITEYYTSTKFKPVRDLATMATEGEAFVVTKGDAIGSRSVLIPVLIIGISMIVAGNLCGTYGIAIAALGMLSFVGTTVSIDAFGPIADNAGGIAESCHLDPEVRVITDELDAVGNTTAAIGKGNAIGSAAFATVALIMSYIGSYPKSNYEDPKVIIAVIVGGIIGGALIEYFSALLTDNTIKSAKLMADEGIRQLKIPGVLEGTKKPDYNRVIGMAADQALKYMLVPSVLALVSPILFGIPFGPEMVLGLLGGSTIMAISRAIFNGNSGGAFDNAKKYIESGMLKGHGKGSHAHKAAVVGDTVGDTRKDVVGVALDIFIKTMSTVANTLAPIFYNYRLF